MSGNVSWINEIKNNTDKAFVIWCWDTGNEGEYKDWITGKLVGRNDGGKRVTIAPRAHLRVTGCGVPDGGDRDGKSKCRVLCEASKVMDNNPMHDPGRGLRINRVQGPGEQDQILYYNHETVERIAAINFPRGKEQNLIMTIDEHGLKLTVHEERTSSDWKAYTFGQELGKFILSNLDEIGKLALEAAKAAGKLALL
ncbi:hypothetical protein HSX11_02165 [Oxalobacteraceae bacterium]|nr:hypothetical protein [Oxalobacteraceae bacterium]